MARVLVIEDDPHLRQLLDRLLGQAGYTVTRAATGQSGLDAAVGRDHELILLDLMLPDMPGEQVLDQLLARWPSARVMVVSAVSDISRRAAVLESGAVDFVTKPFTNAGLLARVRARIPTDAGETT